MEVKKLSSLQLKSQDKKGYVSIQNGNSLNITQASPYKRIYNSI